VKRSSYWLDTAPEGPDLRSAPLPATADVAIVGGGLTGLSAAIHLRRKGASVALFEAERVGWGASGRNGGFCTTGLSIGMLEAIDRFGFDVAKRLYLTYDDAIDLVERLIDEEAIDCNFARTGKLSLACKPSHYERLAAAHELLNARLGRDTLLVPRASIRTEVGTDFYYGGLVEPQAAGLHVGKFVRGLEAAAIRLGAHVLEGARVTRLVETSDQRVEVQSTRGKVTAKQVLVATDGYTDGLVPHYRRRIVPVGSFIVATEQLEPSLVDELIPRRRMAADSKNLLYYFRITPDNRMLFGGRAQFALSNPSSDARSAKILEAGMVQVYPQLAGRRIDYAWGGQVGMTLDRMPHAGQHKGIYYSLGYNGHGVQMATYMGRQMAEVLDGHLDANPWSDLAFRAVPFHFGKPWFLPFADLYFRFRDAVS
jgi:glycine/D-amino acid oxidase-like deaminating enzyme